ncbi:MAG TPA: glutathione S-transferase [Rubrivivax sp.]|jgi:glutathione S-transferase|nr:glutathione S-transferase [Rubrivivax sp.]
MITLCGTPVSNYYNKVKLALLEKGVPFEEMRTGVPGVGLTDATLMSASPLGKIPFITVDGRPLCESQVIVDYIEAAYPQPPLLPADAYAAAKVRELATFIDLHLELVARELYASAFFGGPALSDASRDRVRRQLLKNIAAFKTLARFSPFVAGDTFTLADCSAFASLPVVSMASKAIYGEDLLDSAGIDVKAYVRAVGERPSAVRVIADRKAAQAAYAEQAAARKA